MQTQSAPFRGNTPFLLSQLIGIIVIPVLIFSLFTEIDAGIITEVTNVPTFVWWTVAVVLLGTGFFRVKECLTFHYLTDAFFAKKTTAVLLTYAMYVFGFYGSFLSLCISYAPGFAEKWQAKLVAMLYAYVILQVYTSVIMKSIREQK